MARGEETAKKVAVYGSPRCDELKKLNEISPRSSGKREKSKREREKRKVSFSSRDTKLPDRFLEMEEEEEGFFFWI